MNERPSRRLDDLVITESGDDLLVYDTTTNSLHTLNALAAEIFRRCDGSATVDDLARETGVDENSVREALHMLREAGLLDDSGLTGLPATTSRRRLLRKAGIAIGAPAIASVTMPLASAAQSFTCTPPGEPCEFNNPGACCNHTCMGTPSGPICV